MKQSPLIILLLLLGLLIPGAAHAAQKEIIFAYPVEGWPPYLIPQEKSGIMVDVLQNIATKIGFKVITHHYPDKRCKMMLEQQTIDIWPKAQEWTRHPDHYLWTDPVVSSDDILIFRKGEKTPIKSQDDLEGMRIGCVYGFSYPELAALFESRLAVRQDALNTESMLEMLKIGRTDVAVTNRLVAGWVIKNSPMLEMDEFQFGDVKLESAPYRFAFSKNDKWIDFIYHFNKELMRMRITGELQTILDRYQ